MWTLQEPMTWESVVPALQFQGKTVQSIKLRPIVLNFIGEGQPEAHDPYANNQFLDTRGMVQGRIHGTAAVLQVLNATTTLSLNVTYVPDWLKPIEILDPPVSKFGVPCSSNAQGRSRLCPHRVHIATDSRPYT